jgi:hypothetical protein
MLKRIADWQQRAEPLCDKIIDRMPERCRDLVAEWSRNCRNDTDRDARLVDLWGRDPLAARWIELQDHAVGLPFELFGLAAEIEWRLNRKPTS